MDYLCEVCLTATDLTKTSDSHWICLKCLSTAADYWKNSVITLERAQQADTRIKRYEKTLWEMMYRLPKWSEAKGLNSRKGFQEVEKALTAFTEQQYLKAYYTCNIDEQTAALLAVTQTLGFKGYDENRQRHTTDSDGLTQLDRDFMRAVWGWYLAKNTNKQCYDGLCRPTNLEVELVSHPDSAVSVM